MQSVEACKHRGEIPQFIALENVKIYIRFIRDRRRLKRQLLTTLNDLTKVFPTEIMEWIAAYILKNAKPKCIEPVNGFKYTCMTTQHELRKALGIKMSQKQRYNDYTLFH